MSELSNYNRIKSKQRHWETTEMFGPPNINRARIYYLPHHDLN